MSSTGGVAASRGLLLARWAIERRAAALYDPFNLAFAGGARLTFAGIDLKIVLEVAERAIGTAMIAQRRTSSFDRIHEYGFDGVDEFFGAFVRPAVAVGKH